MTEALDGDLRAEGPKVAPLTREAHKALEVPAEVLYALHVGVLPNDLTRAQREEAHADWFPFLCATLAPAWQLGWEAAEQHLMTAAGGPTLNPFPETPAPDASNVVNATQVRRTHG